MRRSGLFYSTPQSYEFYMPMGYAVHRGIANARPLTCYFTNDSGAINTTLGDPAYSNFY